MAIRTILDILVQKGTIKDGFADMTLTRDYAFVRLSYYISFHAGLDQSLQQRT